MKTLDKKCTVKRQKSKPGDSDVPCGLGFTPETQHLRTLRENKNAICKTVKRGLFPMQTRSKHSATFSDGTQYGVERTKVSGANFSTSSTESTVYSNMNPTADCYNLFSSGYASENYHHPYRDFVSNVNTTDTDLKVTKTYYLRQPRYPNIAGANKGLFSMTPSNKGLSFSSRLSTRTYPVSNESVTIKCNQVPTIIQNANEKGTETLDSPDQAPIPARQSSLFKKRCDVTLETDDLDMDIIVTTNVKHKESPTVPDDVPREFIRVPLQKAAGPSGCWARLDKVSYLAQNAYV